MTTKTAGKAPVGHAEASPSREQLHAAHQAHALAQMLYGQMAATHPWIASPQMPTFDPWTGHQGTPWMQSWPTAWYGPTPQMTHHNVPWAPPGYFGPDVFPR